MRRFWNWLKATLGLVTIDDRLTAIEGLQRTQGDVIVRLRRRMRAAEVRASGGSKRHHKPQRYDEIERDRSRHVHPARH